MENNNIKDDTIKRLQSENAYLKNKLQQIERNLFDSQNECAKHFVKSTGETSSQYSLDDLEDYESPPIVNKSIINNTVGSWFEATIEDELPQKLSNVAAKNTLDVITNVPAKAASNAPVTVPYISNNNELSLHVDISGIDGFSYLKKILYNKFGAELYVENIQSKTAKIAILATGIIEKVVQFLTKRGYKIKNKAFILRGLKKMELGVVQNCLRKYGFPKETVVVQHKTKYQIKHPDKKYNILYYIETPYSFDENLLTTIGYLFGNPVKFENYNKMKNKPQMKN